MRPARRRGSEIEFRVVWKREGLRSRTKRFATRPAAERMIVKLTSPEPWRAYLSEGESPDDYLCCSGHECGCGGMTYRKQAEDMRANQPKLEWTRLEMRPVGQWATPSPEPRDG